MNALLLAWPEIFLALSGMFLLLLGTLGEGRFVGMLTAAALAVCAVMVGTLPQEGVGLGGMIIVDGFARFSKIMLLIASSLALGLVPSFFAGKREARAEYPSLVLFATLGMMIMVSANDWMALYVGLELQNLALYVLASFNREDKRSSEAGMKYFVLGAVSSAILLFGISLLYGFSGTTTFDGMATALTARPIGVAIAGLAFVVAGFAFKISAVPFHMWTPDVYEGAPTPVTAFLTAAPKVAALVLLCRVLMGPLAPLTQAWEPILMALAVFSMVLGSFAGLGQKNIKRLMAYSAIAHVGIMLVGLIAATRPGSGAEGIAGILIYLALYFASALGAFGALLCLRSEGKPIEEIAALSGLFKTHPALALALGASLFSLAGIPPLAGFFGKYFIFLAAVKGELIGLTVLAVLTSVVAAAYYLRIVKVMAFDAPHPENGAQPIDKIPDAALRAVTTLTALAVALYILAPSPLMDGAKTAAESLFIR